ncbi:hypothetical protein M3212_03570 [Alkalihalobacillus oceani]|uniref:hypothetical protein n=1 Tax=Halalkalibacter oceani TaxID=1653776 RepID=UPI0020405733|nr:hypothetical protein [Halalkalibacter oceani]MCM3759864.1 hypothetical protein [Halalkalibacter oceani]
MKYLFFAMLFLAACTQSDYMDGEQPSFVGEIIEMEDDATLVVKITGERDYHDIRLGVPESYSAEDFSIGQAISIWTGGIHDTEPPTAMADRIEIH